MLEIGFAGAYLLYTAVAAGSLVHIRGFLAGTPAIANPDCLERYKRFVRVQMYLALAVLAFFALCGFLAALFIRETRCRNIWAPPTAQAQG